MEMSRLPLQKILDSLEEINQKFSADNSTADMIKLSKEQKKISQKASLAKEILDYEKAINQNQELLNEVGFLDEEIKELTLLDVNEKQELLEISEAKLLSLLAPTDSRDENNIIIEMRAGAGGDESSLFAADLLRMYNYFADRLGFKLKIISQSLNDLGGFKEVIAEIRGEDVFSWFKYEGGVHRVQRVPSTEKQGRIHTSTVAVALMPLIEENNNEFKLNPKDIEITTSTAGGNGGQSVNTTYSAVRMRHIPTGLEAQSQDEKNQIQNRNKCLLVLTSRVFNFYEQDRLEKEAKERNQQVGRMDRSEKIRTYNFPQDRLTDHRYNKSWNQLPSILDGEIYQVVLDIKKVEAEKVLQNLDV